MITLEPQLEQQIKSAAAIKGLSGSGLIKNLFVNYQLEQKALKRAKLSYAGCKKTTNPIALNLLHYSHPITYSEVENTDGLAFINIEDAAQCGKQLRSSAWNRRNQHD